MLDKKTLQTIIDFNQQNHLLQTNGSLFAKGDITISTLDFIYGNNNFLIIYDIKDEVIICKDKDNTEIEYQIYELVNGVQFYTLQTNQFKNQTSDDIDEAINDIS